MMINLEESNSLIAQLPSLTNTEKLPLNDCLGRVLAHDVLADIHQPSFDKSAMDGYACRREDLQFPLKIIGVIAAGTLVEEAIQQGECYRIFTGAPVPPGANCVVMQEDTELNSDGLMIFKAQKTNDNICRLGEDCKIGEKVLEMGTVIGPQHLATLAGNGVVLPEVFCRVSVALFCSGSELIEPLYQPSGAMIRNSNASQLMGQMLAIGAKPDYEGIVPDDLDEICQNLKTNLGKYEVLIITGGASVGDYDFIPTVLKSLGAEVMISSLNIQPGKPVLLAKIDHTYIIGLSGNPVSSFLQTKLLVEPLLLKLMGANRILPKMIKIPLFADVSRKKGNRKLFLPAKINEMGEGQTLSFNGSAHLLALNLADGFIVMDPGIMMLKKHDLVPMLLI
jgi:molybdopterin molybdotransferase